MVIRTINFSTWIDEYKFSIIPNVDTPTETVTDFENVNRAGTIRLKDISLFIVSYDDTILTLGNLGF